MKFTVTQDMIDKAMKRREERRAINLEYMSGNKMFTGESIQKIYSPAQHCPVAQALDAAGVSHGGCAGPGAEDDEGNVFMPFPISVGEWISSFDCGQEVEPFEFEAEIMEVKECES